MPFAAIIRSMLALALLPLALHSQSRPARSDFARPRISVGHTPAGLVNGSPCLFRVQSAPPLKDLAGVFLGRRVFFNFDASTGTWYGLAGAGIDTPPGPHSLTLESTLLTGGRFSSVHSITIDRAKYRAAELAVPSRFTAPDAAARARIKAERAIKSAAFRRVSRERHWSGRFAAPVDDIVTEPFGVARIFNGVLQSTHQGVDYRAATGTPVLAMNGGRVLLAREMFHEGGFLVLDHGQGLLSLHMHLSRIDVREGDRVAKGQIVARSGENGRATGPHLHAGVRWQGLYLDLATLLKMELP
ncbi:MAG: M23 family metallopeptidase [Blastocatellia bacterium]|nr:M23 family metallopeptidase [Blastocatellia bacterium]